MLKRILSVVIVLSMLMSMTPNVFAAEWTESEEPIKYVSVGDSMTNAYGLPGYDYVGHDASVDCDVVDCDNPAHQIWVSVNGYLQAAPGAYPTMFANWLESETGKEVEHTQLAISGSRVEELLFLLQLDWEDDEVIQFLHDARNWGAGQDLSAPYINSYFDEAAWDEMFDHGDIYTWRNFIHFRGASRWFDENFRRLPGNDIPAGESIIKHVAKKHQQAIIDADIINVGNGNSDFGVFLLSRVINSLSGSAGSDGDDSWINLETALKECDPQARELALSAYEQIKAELISQVDFGVFNPTIDQIVNIFAYALVNFFQSYKDMMDTILEMNPDAEIMQLGVLNVLKNFKVKMLDGQIFEMGDAIQILVDTANAYMAAVPTIYQMTGDEKYAQATFYYFDAENIDLMRAEYSMAKDAGWKNYETIRDRLIFEINAQTVFELVGPVVNAMTDGVMQAAGAQAGIPLNGNDLIASRDLNRNDVEEYERYLKAKAKYEEEKAAWELDNTLPEPVAPTTWLSNKDILACATYLDCEFATVEASKIDALDMSTFAGLASWETLVNEVVSMGNAVAARVLYNEQGQIKQEIIDGMVNALTGNVTADVTNDVTAWIAAGGDARMYEIYMYATTSGKAFDTAALELYIAADPAAYQAKYVAYVKKHAETFVTDYISTNLTPILAEEMMNSGLIMGLLNLYISLQAGGGVSMHPSASGHLTIYRAAVDAYKNGRTASKETEDNLLELVNMAYAKAYEEALANGHIDMAKAYIDQAIEAVITADSAVKNASVPAELETAKLLLLEELANTVQTLDKVKALLDITVLNETAFQQIMDMKGQLAKHVQTIGALANELNLQGELALDRFNTAADYYTGVITGIVTNAYTKVMAEAADFAKAYAAFVETVGTAVDQISPALGAVVRAYLTETPAEALAIMYAAGEEAVDMFVATAVTASGSIKEIISGLSAILKADANALVQALKDANVAAINNEIAIAKAKIAGLKQTIEDAIRNGELVATIKNYEALLQAAEADLEILESRLLQTIIATIKEVVDPATAAMVETVFAELKRAIAIAEAAGEQYGQWFAGRFDQMAGDLLNLIITNTKKYGILAGEIIDEMIRTFLSDVKQDVQDKVDEIIGGIKIPDIDLSDANAVIGQLKAIAADIRAQIAALKAYTNDKIDAEVEKLEAALAQVEAYTEKLQALVNDVEDFVNKIDEETELTIEKVQAIVKQTQDIAADAKELVAKAKASMVMLAQIYEEAIPQIVALTNYIEEGSPADKFADIAGMEIDAFIDTVAFGYESTRAAIEQAAANIDAIVTEAVAAVTESAATAVAAITDATKIAANDIIGNAQTAIATIKTQAIALTKSADAKIAAAGNQILAQVHALEQNCAKDDLMAKLAEVEIIVNELIAVLESAENVMSLEEVEVVLGKAVVALEALGAVAQDIYAIAEEDVVNDLREAVKLAKNAQKIIADTAGSISADAIAAYNASVTAICTAADNTVKAVLTAITAYENAVVTAAGEIIATVTKAAEDIGDEVAVVVGTAVEAVETSIDRAENGIAAIKEAFQYALYDTTHGEYESNCSSYYVALGNAAYADELAAALGLAAHQHAQFALSEIDKVAGADLITVKFDNGEFLTFAYDRVMGMVAEVINNSVVGQMVNNPTYGPILKDILESYNVDLNAEVTQIDWSKFDATVIEAKNDILAAVAAILRDQNVPEVYVLDLGPKVMEILNEGLDTPIITGLKIEIEIPVMDLLVGVAETALYGYFDFAAEFPAMLNQIRAIAPAAEVLVTGINDLDLTVLPAIVTENINVDEYSQYMEYVVDALNLHIFAYAAINTDTTYVEEDSVEGILNALAVTRVEHVWGEWYTSKEPTNDEEGEERRDCLNPVCVHYETREIPKIVRVDPEYTVPTGLTATYGDTLADIVLPEGFTWKDATATVGNAGTNTFTAIFTPEDTIHYNTVEVEVSVEVAKADPADVTAPTGITATYGDTLADIVLPEGFAWKDATASVGNAGTNRFTVVYTPADTDNYNVVEFTVEVAVAKAEPTYTAPTGLIAKYGDTLADIVLPEGFAWKDATASVGNAGTHTFTVVYTPADTDNYDVVEFTVEVTVIKVEPGYTVPTGLSATYGDTLADIALPEGFAWKNPTATVGNAGTNSFTVVYTPADTDNYEIVEFTVEVTVAKAEPTYTAPTGITATYGDTLADIALPEGFAWKDATASVGNAGTNRFTVVYTPADTDNYNVVEFTVEVTVGKANAAVPQAPTAVENLVANGSAQALVNAGTATGGTMVYSLSENGPFSATLPTATNAGTYTVYYKVQGDANHNDTQVQSLTVMVYPGKITSDEHAVEESTHIRKIEAGMTVGQLLNNINEKAYVTIFDKDGNVADSNALVATGMVAKLILGGQVIDSVTVIVTGDVNGDGKVSITDMTAVKYHVLEKTALTGVYMIAADTSNDGNISITDVTQIKYHILEKTSIEAN